MIVYFLSREQPVGASSSWVLHSREIVRENQWCLIFVVSGTTCWCIPVLNIAYSWNNWWKLMVVSFLSREQRAGASPSWVLHIREIVNENSWLFTILGLSWAMLGLSWIILGMTSTILDLSQAIFCLSWACPGCLGPLDFCVSMKHHACRQNMASCSPNTMPVDKIFRTTPKRTPETRRN